MCLFNRFCNFYQQFVRQYSRIIKLLIALTLKDTIFEQTPKCQEAFDKLKTAIVNALILQHFDRTRTYYVEYNASDYVTAGVLSQKDNKGVLYPVAFFSRKISLAEYNYKIYNKELLAIIWCFKEQCPDLKGSNLPIQVLTDYKNLEYFMTTKQLTQRQARQAEFLADYHFQITY